MSTAAQPPQLAELATETGYASSLAVPQFDILVEKLLTGWDSASAQLPEHRRMWLREMLLQGIDMMVAEKFQQEEHLRKQLNVQLKGKDKRQRLIAESKACRVCRASRPFMSVPMTDPLPLPCPRHQMQFVCYAEKMVKTHKSASAPSKPLPSSLYTLVTEHDSSVRSVVDLIPQEARHSVRLCNNCWKKIKDPMQRERLCSQVAEFYHEIREWEGLKEEPLAEADGESRTSDGVASPQSRKRSRTSYESSTDGFDRSLDTKVGVGCGAGIAALASAAASVVAITPLLAAQLLVGRVKGRTLDLRYVGNCQSRADAEVIRAVMRGIQTHPSQEDGREWQALRATLQQVDTVDLSHSSLGPEAAAAIVRPLGHQLKHLLMDGMQLRGVWPQWLQGGAGGMVALRVLRIAFNAITSIPDNFVGMPHLSHLALSIDHMTQPAMQQLLTSLPALADVIMYRSGKLEWNLSSLAPLRHTRPELSLRAFLATGGLVTPVRLSGAPQQPECGLIQRHADTALLTVTPPLNPDAMVYGGMHHFQYGGTVPFTITHSRETGIAVSDLVPGVFLCVGRVWEEIPVNTADLCLSTALSEYLKSINVSPAVCGAITELRVHGLPGQRFTLHNVLSVISRFPVFPNLEALCLHNVNVELIDGDSEALRSLLAQCPKLSTLWYDGCSPNLPACLLTCRARRVSMLGVRLTRRCTLPAAEYLAVGTIAADGAEWPGPSATDLALLTNRAAFPNLKLVNVAGCRGLRSAPALWPEHFTMGVYGPTHLFPLIPWTVTPFAPPQPVPQRGKA